MKIGIVSAPNRTRVNLPNRWPEQLAKLGYQTVDLTAATTIDQVKAAGVQVVAGLGYYGDPLDKASLLNALYNAGFGVFTEGNDSNSLLLPIAQATQGSPTTGTIVPAQRNPLGDWGHGSSEPGDEQYTITAINPAAVPIAIDSTLGTVAAIYLHEPGKGRWFHYQPASFPPDGLLWGALSLISVGSSGAIIDWIKENPVLAAGIGFGAYIVLGGKIRL